MAVLNLSQKALQVSLVPACSFVQVSLKLGILHIGSAVLAPVFGLVIPNISLVKTGRQGGNAINIPWISNIQP